MALSNRHGHGDWLGVDLEFRPGLLCSMLAHEAGFGLKFLGKLDPNMDLGMGLGL